MNTTKKENESKDSKTAFISKSAYTGPLSAADVNMASWNEFFREGGQLNQPHWLSDNKMDDLKDKFSFLARYHK